MGEKGNGQEIAEETEGENGQSEGITGALRVAVEETSKGFAMVFYSSQKCDIQFSVSLRRSHRVRARDWIPRRATILLRDVSLIPVSTGLGSSIWTNFQKVGLNAIESAETVGG